MTVNKSELHSYEFGDFRLTPDERLLLRNGDPVTLPPKVFDALVLLVENHGHLVEKNDFIEHLWSETFVEEATLARMVSSLRKALGEGSKTRFIETVSKRGYRFVAPVRSVVDDDVFSPALLSGPESDSDRPAAAAAAPPESVSTPETRAPRALPAGRSFSRPLLVGIPVIVGVLAIGFFIFVNWTAKPIREITSIAVLPFNQVGEGERDEMLEFGIAEMLITKLSNLKRMIIRPTSAVSKYLGQKPDAVAVGRELRVDAVLQGSIQRSGERVRVTVQLISTDDGSPLWAEHFDTTYTDIFAVQDSISEQAVQALPLQLSGKERELMSKRPTENTEAYQLYITGRYFWNKRNSVDSLNKSIGYYEQAIAKDPHYARAHAGLADCYQVLAEYLATTPQEGFTKAREAAKKALEIDNQLAEAHTSLAYILAFYDWDFPAAEKEFKRAIELDPNYPTAHQWYGEFLIAMGRFDEAKVEYEKALKVDPTSLVFNVELAGYYYATRQFDKAISQAQTVIEMEPYAFGYVFLTFSYGHKGMRQESAESYIKSVELFGEPKEAEELQKVLTRSGIRAMWLKRLEQVDAPARRESFPAQWRALIYMWLGDKEKTLDWLETSVERRDRWMINIKYTPEFDALHAEPRFQTLLKRVGV